MADGRQSRSRVALIGEDPDFASVVLLLDFAGVNGGTDITDLSNSEHVETFLSAAQIETANKFLGENSLLLSGSVDEVNYADHADWDLPADFTVELGINTDATGASQTCIANYDGTIGWWIQYFTGTPAKLRFGWGASVLYSEDWTPFSADTWYHVAVSRSGTNLRVFVDGVQLGSTVTDSTDMSASTGLLRLGSLETAQDWDGNLGAVRITKGVARYTANFTPLTEFYPIT